MNTNLLEIQPEELTFIYELKKQSSCSVRLINNSNKHVAFKVKTTAPKKYCVRPNVGIIMPKSTCDFTVLMQAQGSAPSDLVCKDKFLVQSTIVSGFTSNEDVTRDMFAKGGDKYIEERKLRVSLITPPHSPIPSPMNGNLKQGSADKASIIKGQELGQTQVVIPQEKIGKEGISSKLTSRFEMNPNKDVDSTTESAELMQITDAKLRPPSDAGHIPIKNVEFLPEKDVRPAIDAGYVPAKSAALSLKNVAGSTPIESAESSPTKDEKSKPAKDEGFTLTKNVESSPTDVVKCIPAQDEEFTLIKNAEFLPVKETKLSTTEDVQLRTVKGADLVHVNDAEKLELVKNIEDLKSILVELESKLREADATISKLNEEKRSNNHDFQILRKELEWRNKRGAREVKEGFPLLFVCMVALICIALGYRLRSGI